MGSVAEEGCGGGSSREKYAQFMEDSFCARSCLGPNPMMARYAYALIFLVTNLLAWIARDYAHSALSKLQRLKGCHGARYCLGAEGVLRISFGCFMFFFVMFLSTVGTKKVEDCRNSWHSEWWPAKIIMWLAIMMVPFFIPSAFIQFYGKFAHFGAGAFLLIQLVSVISFITWLNDRCRLEKNAKRCCRQESPSRKLMDVNDRDELNGKLNVRGLEVKNSNHILVLALSIAAYGASIVGIILMYVWYAPKPSCSFNILFITLTLALLQFTTFVSIHPKVKAGYLAPGLMGLYSVFLCWSAIRSEPRTEICNKKAQAAVNADWLTIASFVIAVLVVVMATFSTGIDSKCFQLKKTEPESEDDVPYGYGFFHLVFGTGAMHFAMLFVGWNSHQTMPKWTIDVGWGSTWVRIVNQWLASLIYVWMLIAPLAWKRRQLESA